MAQHAFKGRLMAARRPLDRSNAADRSLIAKLGGYARWAGTTPEERSLEAQRRGEATLAKYGRGHYVRLNLIKHGRLTK